MVKKAIGVVDNIDLGFLDNFNEQPTFLSKEHNLIKPNLQNSVAGFLPEIIRHWNVDLPDNKINKLVVNKNIAKKVEESFPSGFNNIIFLLTDAVGVYHLSKLGGPLWENITTQGAIANSCFPTMTATVMTSISYGLHPSSHGVMGYNHYNENVSHVWNALNLKYRKQNDEIGMVLDDFELPDLVAGEAITDTIFKQNIPISFTLPVELKPPGLGNLINPSLSPDSYKSIEEGVQKVMRDVNTPGSKIAAMYMPHADYAAHGYGPESEQYGQAIRAIEQVIGAFTNHPSVKNGDTIIVLTSDHGQVQVDHSISKWMNQKDRLSLKEEGVNLSSSGRVIHAYHEPQQVDKAVQVLEKLVDGKGIVLENKQAMELSGGIGALSVRMGGHVAIYEDKYMYDVPEVETQDESTHLNGQHGSLTPQELYVPIGIFGGNG